MSLGGRCVINQKLSIGAVARGEKSANDARNSVEAREVRPLVSKLAVSADETTHLRCVSMVKATKVAAHPS